MPTCRIMPNGRLAVFWFKSPQAVRTFGSRLDPVPISVLRMLRQHKKTPRCIVIAGPNGAGKTTFRIEMVFLRLRSPRIALHRIAARVRQGGHDVSRPDVLRR